MYQLSRGSRTLLLDAQGPGGQAGTSSRIENYLGFPSGVSGNGFDAPGALAQAQRLRAQYLVPVCVTAVTVSDGYKTPHT